MRPTLLLAIATLALVVGPLLERVGRRLPALAAWIDGATVGGICVVAFIHLLPEAGAHLGGWTLLLFAAGLTLPTIAERLVQESGQGLRWSVGGLVLVLLLLHEVIESAALASKAYDERIGLATLLVIVGHRLPLGLFLWGQARRRLSLAWSIAVLGFVALASLGAPYLVPERFRAGEFSAVLSALLAGGLVHLVLQHRPPLGGFEHEPRKRNAWSALGTAMAAGFFVPYLMGVDVGHGHATESPQLPDRLWGLIQVVALPLLVGAFAASLIEAFRPRSIAPWLARRSRAGQAAAGALVGVILPVIASGRTSRLRGLPRDGVPSAAGLALFVATAVIGIDSILLSLALLGGPMTLVRAASAVALALTVGFVAGGLPRGRSEVDGSAEPEPTTPRSLCGALGRGMVETWGHLAPWMLVGIGLTALVEPWISADWVRSLPAWQQIALLSLAGIPTSLCASAATPFAALLLAKGFMPGAVLAFLLTSPVLDLATVAALRRERSHRVAFTFAATMLLATWALALAAGALSAGPTPGAPPALEPRDYGWPTWIAVLLLALWTLWVLVREGPRGFLAQLGPEDSAQRCAHEQLHAEHGEHASQPA